MNGRERFYLSALAFCAFGLAFGLVLAISAVVWAVFS